MIKAPASFLCVSLGLSLLSFRATRWPLSAIEAPVPDFKLLWME